MPDTIKEHTKKQEFGETESWRYWWILGVDMDGRQLGVGYRDGCLEMRRSAALWRRKYELSFWNWPISD